MTTITALYTKRKYNPVSWLIRFMIPRSRLALAESSHCLIVDGDYLIQAEMWFGVTRKLRADGLKGLTIVAQRDYDVADVDAGLKYARDQVGKSYDYAGALGLVEPDRNWQDESKWDCFELFAATLKVAGRDLFVDDAKITGSILLSLKA